MERNRTLRALVLAQRQRGENNRELYFLSDSEGLLSATLWGGPKNKLRSLLSPWHLGNLYLYHDPVRKSDKIQDFDPVNQFLGLREDLDRTWAASAISEVIIKSRASFDTLRGAPIEAFALCIDSLEGLEKAAPYATRPLFLRWLWRWLALIGYAYDINSCAICEKTFENGKVLWYDRRDNCFLCNSCKTGILETGRRSLYLPLSPGLRHWLVQSTLRSAKEQGRVSLERSLLEEASILIIAMALEILGKELETWNTWPL